MSGQLSLLESSMPAATGDWNPDDWETPDCLAQKMASLVLPTDRRILEPAAGTGQIAKYLPRSPSPYIDTICMEINEARWNKGRMSGQEWYHADFLNEAEYWSDFSLIITNPPFSLASDFIARGLQILDRSYEYARLLYLLPADFFQSVGRNQAFRQLDAHIHHTYQIVNRVAYLKNGVVVKGRQVYDAVFDIRPGKQDAAVTFLEAA